MTSSKQADTLLCHTTMNMNSISFLYNPGHMTLWCLEVVPVANAREGSTQEHDWVWVIIEKDKKCPFLFQTCLQQLYRRCS